MPKYRVKPGFTFGAQKQYKPGDIVELTEEESAGFLDKLELAKGKKAQEPSTLQQAILDASDADLADVPGGANAWRAWARGEKTGAVKEGGLVVNPAPKSESDPGWGITQTGATPPTLSEMDAPKNPRVPRR